MVLTVLEGRVAPDQWDKLKQVYHEANQKLPPPILETYLVQDSNSPDIWRIMTVWRSREALQAYRASVETPGGVLMFRAAGAEPTLSIFDIVEHVVSPT